MNIRAFHFDMKGMIPKADFMLELLPELSDMGYNAVLLELEDKYPYQSIPEIVHPDAWSLEEFAAFRNKASQCGIEIIPLLQCAGHLDYILKHKRFKHLREGIAPRDTTTQWCLGNGAEPFAIWSALFRELRETFSASRYFHIGADEFNFRLPCDRCNAENRFELFIRHVLRCARYAVEAGCRPIVWDDTFRHRDSAELDELLAMVIPCIWQYRGIDEKIVRRMCERSPEVWGASKIQNDDLYHGLGSQRAVECNVDDWADVNRKYPLTGHIGTIWARNQGLSPLAATLPESFYMLAYLGQTLTAGRIRARRKFQTAFAKRFFQLSDAAFVDDLAFAPDEARQKLDDALKSVSKNRAIIEIWQVLNEIDRLHKYCDLCFCYDCALLPGLEKATVPDELTGNFLDGVQITRERADALEKNLHNTLSRYFCAGGVAEFIDSRLRALRKRNANWERILTSARANKSIEF